MIVNRSWRELARRWGFFGDSQTGQMEVADRVQLVALVDDASYLNLPPMIPRWGLYALIVGAVAEYSHVWIAPQTRPVIIDYIANMGASSTAFVYHVQQGAHPTPGVNMLLQTQSYLGGPLNAIRDAHVHGGTQAVDLRQAVTTGSTSLLDFSLTVNASGGGGGTNALNPRYVVVPGQYFSIQTSATNTAMQVGLRFYEIPADSWETSGPK